MARTILVPGAAAQYENYRAAIAQAGGTAVFTRPGEPEQPCDGLLLPGGGDMEPWRYNQENLAARNLEPDRDAAELALLASFTAAGKPILGICRGLQVINVFFGGTLIQDLPGHAGIVGMDRIHSVQTCENGLLSLCSGRCLVNSSHHQAVDRLGKGLEAVQWAPDGTVEALRHRTLPVWAVQWHPERLCGNLSTAGVADGGRLFSAFIRRCGG